MIRFSSLRSLHHVLFSTILTYAGFVLFSLLITLNILEPKLIFHHIQPFFSLDPNYIREFSDLPGEYINFFAEFLIQLYYFPVLGSVVITLVLVFIALFTQYIWKTAFVGIPAIFILPSVILLILHKNYNYPYTLDIILFLSLLYLVACKATLSLIKPWVRLIVHGVFLEVFFYFSGLSGALTYSLLVLIFEITYLKHLYSLAVIPVLLAGNIIIAAFQEPLMTGSSYTELIKQQLPAFTRMGYLMIMILYVLFIIIQKYRISFIINSKTKKQFAGIWNRRYAYVTVILLFACMLLLKGKLFQNKEKYLTELDYMAYHGKWNKVLQLARTNDMNERMVKFQVNRALCHTGIMDDDLFSIDQSWGEHGLILSEIFNRKCLIPMSDLTYEIGYIKAANYWALEAHTYYPYYPRILKMLAVTFLLNEDYKSAEKYLNILKHSFVHKKWANEHAQYLYQKKPLIDNAEFAQKLAYNTDSILYIKTMLPHFDLIELIKKNPENRLAFDYLLSYFLLKKKLPEFYKYSQLYMKVFNYKRLPKTFEEAVLLLYIQNNVDYNTIKRHTTPVIFNRCEDFMTTLQMNPDNKEKARLMLANNYRNTYWYYYYFVKPNVVKKDINTY